MRWILNVCRQHIVHNSSNVSAKSGVTASFDRLDRYESQRSQMMVASVNICKRTSNKCFMIHSHHDVFRVRSEYSASLCPQILYITATRRQCAGMTADANHLALLASQGTGNTPLLSDGVLTRATNVSLLPVRPRHRPVRIHFFICPLFGWFTVADYCFHVGSPRRGNQTLAASWRQGTRTGAVFIVIGKKMYTR